jgi:sporulation protein YlmC with PRC-barrel domain
MIMKKSCVLHCFNLKETRNFKEISMRLVMLAFVITCIFALPATAASYSQKTEQIIAVNRMAPLQNPKYDRSEEILGRRMLDRKNKVVGDIEDVVLNEYGGIAFLDVKFDRIRLPRAVFVNYTGFDIQPVTNGYAMTFEASEIEGAYPQMLADIATAAGDEDTYSLKKLRGVSVKTSSGRIIGQVDDILFGGNGERAEAFYIGLTVGTLRGRSVAVPFGEVNLAKVASAREVTISDETADTLIDIAKDK